MPRQEANGQNLASEDPGRDSRGITSVGGLKRSKLWLPRR